MMWGMDECRIVYRGKARRQVRLTIDPRSDFRNVLQVMEEVEVAGDGLNPRNLRFALLELINNSLRAHREKKVDRPITVTFTASDRELGVSIRDHGRGFDPATLPYRLEDDHRALDPRSESFQRYQERHDHQRFGLGLLLARRTFPRFELLFLDADERPTRWGAGPVDGTLIRLGTGDAAGTGGDGRVG